MSTRYEPFGAAMPRDRRLSFGVSTHGLAGAAVAVVAVTGVSRLLGLGREALVAGLFGAGPETDAFFAAFRVPDVVFNSLMSFLVAACFLPVFAECLAADGRNSAGSLARATLATMSALLATLAGAIAIWAPDLMRLLAPGLAPDVRQLSVDLVRIMAPIVVLGGISGLAKSVLNASGVYLLPAAMPAAFNIVVIAAILAFAARWGIKGLAFGIVAAAACQCLMLLPALQRAGFSLRGSWLGEQRRLRRVGALAAPLLLGLALGQAMGFVELHIASRIGGHAVSYLNYAGRLFSLPEQLFMILVVTLVFPSLSHDAARGNTARLASTAAGGLRLAILLMLPVSVLVGLFSREIVDLVLGRGAFDGAAAEGTAWALSAFAVGLAGICARNLLTYVFFARQEMRVPLIVSATTLPASVALALSLVPLLSYAALPLASSLGAWVECAVLGACLRRRLGDASMAGLGTALAKGSLCALTMLTVLLWLRSAMPPEGGATLLLDATQLLMAAGAGGVAYGLAACVVDLEGARAFPRKLIERLMP